MNDENSTDDRSSGRASGIPAGPDDAGQVPPTKVCSKCSVQTQTSGSFCPHCGASYVAKQRRIGTKAVAIVAATCVGLAAVAVGVVLKVRHDREEDRKAEAAAAAAAETRAAEEAAEKKQAAKEARAAADRAERKVRASLIRQMQRAITKDAKERVADGELDGPIYYTSCDPLGGGSVDDLTALTTTFECLAVNEKLDGGQVRGWVFSATANWNEASWTWHLGR